MRDEGRAPCDSGRYARRRATSSQGLHDGCFSGRHMLIAVEPKARTFLPVRRNACMRL
jgi:hypothetical protein